MGEDMALDMEDPMEDTEDFDDAFMEDFEESSFGDEIGCVTNKDSTHSSAKQHR